MEYAFEKGWANEGGIREWKQNKEEREMGKNEGKGGENETRLCQSRRGNRNRFKK